MRFRIIWATIVLGLGISTAAAQDLRRSVEKVSGRTDPQLVSDSSGEAHILRDVYEGLTTYGPAGSIVPGMAESWDISEDGRVYTFHLRDARWSNGDALTPDDFRYALERLFDPATASENAYRLSAIQGAKERLEGHYIQIGVTVNDNRTLTISLTEADPLFLTRLSHPAAAPLHQASNRANNGYPVVNGPFKFEQISPGEMVSLVKNDQYYGAAEVSPGAVRYWQRPASLAARALLDGIHLSAYSQLAADGLRLANNTMVFVARTSTVYVAIVNTATIDDPAVRRALSAALDRRSLVSQLNGDWIPTMSLQGDGPNQEPADPTAPECCRLNPDTCNQEPDCGKDDEFSLDLQQLLQGKDITLVSSQIERSMKIAAEMERAWEALGASVHVVNITNVTDALQSDAYDVTLMPLSTDTGDPLELFRWLDQRASKWISEPEFNSLIDAATASASSERAARLSDAEKALLAERGVIPLMAIPAINVVAPNLQGWIPNAADVHLSRYLRVSQ
ncbi:peptide ABC transporter substrate-binding protein [Rhizobium leguminosarum]|uniref:peptide ABC transporter substrate-binding protein n=1 Tax=Rhizobium leguminosarum TaxID=384 RepID=UPI003F9E0242